MDNTKKATTEDRLDRTIEGGAVSRRWLLKNTAGMAAGTIAASGLSAAAAEAKPAAAIEKASAEHDPHTSQAPAYHAAAFEGWESV
jgi:hypothetical protein